jgi:hypothetical protein
MVKRQGREAHNSLSSDTEVKNGGAIPPFPIRVRGLVLNKLNTGETSLTGIFKNCKIKRSYHVSLQALLQF